MAQMLRDVMSRDVQSLDSSATMAEAAEKMRANDIGDVLVTGLDGSLQGIVTDRDLVVRGLAAGRDAASTPISEVCSGEPVSLPEDAEITEAVKLMRDKAIRRLAVVNDNRPIGVVSLGDLAEDRDPDSALAEISRKPPGK